jgi:phosphatidylinositol-3,4,5-trisphosphate 3-phosphatase/dual-specificity protein phosphatase PTEN
MGFPAANLEKIYRNSMTDTQNFFNKRHEAKYKIYNLCSERTYADNSFYKQAYCPFDDHEAPRFQLIIDFCKDVHEWLTQDKSHIAGIHCKAGKGRTGTMICCYLMYCKFVKNATDALNFYGNMRTQNGKGVTIPSQIRYIYYFEHYLNGNLTYPPNNKLPIIKITKIKFLTVPNFNMMTSGCTPYFNITNNNLCYEYKQYNKIFTYSKNESTVEFKNINYDVNGDFKIEFFNKGTMGKDKMFKLWLNTFFLPNDGLFIAKKSMLDKACKDTDNKYFDPRFKVEIHYIFQDFNKNDIDLTPFNN